MASVFSMVEKSKTYELRGLTSRAQAQPPSGTLHGMMTNKSHKINRNWLGSRCIGIACSDLLGDFLALAVMRWMNAVFPFV